MHGSQNIKITRSVRKIATSNHKLRNVCMSVRPPTWNNSAPTRRIFMKFYIPLLVKTRGENSKFTKLWQEEKKYIHLKQYLDDFFAKRQKFQTQVTVKVKTHFMFKNCFVSEIRAVYKITSKNTPQSSRPTYDNTTHAHCMLDNQC